eukprot:TRINITY_DN17884_c0_g1_i1.p1 TRINITY_DN17884_c0_g1~~TRINITY_DN17884_c0_g1_i1.p1  ORF type:complete len:616 (+),score=111.10 TRINITY_DN17884_c0_g1_i1:116-1849(+)
MDGTVKGARSSSRGLESNSQSFQFDQSEVKGSVKDGSGSPELLFEEILPDQPFHWGGAGDQAPHLTDSFIDDEDYTTRAGSSKIQKKIAPVADDVLYKVDLLSLQRDEVIWAVGRAASLKLGSAARLWGDLSQALSAHGGEADLSSSEVCRVLQALAYAPSDVPLDTALLRRLLKVFALRAKEYSDERLMRVVYAYGKLAAKRGVSMPRFMDFATSEVIERDQSLAVWRKVRILEAIGSLPEAGPEFKVVLVGQVVKNLKALDAECLMRFVPLLVEANYHQRSGVINTLNGVFKRKLKHINFNNPDLILHTGLPMLLYDLMKTSTLLKWLERLHHLQIPLAIGAMPRVSQASAEKPIVEVREDEAASWNSEIAEEFPELSGKFHQQRPQQQEFHEPADALRVARNLEALKLADMCLRHERQSTLQSLPPKVQRLLNTARDTPLAPPEELQLPELPHVFWHLRRLFKASGILLHPTVYGPYLLELADPLGRIAVEWDKNWLLYPPWRQSRHKEYVQRKHLHLKAEGWQVHLISLEQFQALRSWDEKLEFASEFCRQYRLDHLQLKSEDRFPSQPSSSI